MQLIGSIRHPNLPKIIYRVYRWSLAGVASESMGKIGSISWQGLRKIIQNAVFAALNDNIRQKDEPIDERKEELMAYRAASNLMKTKEGISGEEIKKAGR